GQGRADDQSFQGMSSSAGNCAFSSPPALSPPLNGHTRQTLRGHKRHKYDPLGGGYAFASSRPRAPSRSESVMVSSPPRIRSTTPPLRSTSTSAGAAGMR